MRVNNWYVGLELQTNEASEVEKLSSERPSCNQERIKTRRYMYTYLEPGNCHSPDAMIAMAAMSAIFQTRLPCPLAQED